MSAFLLSARRTEAFVDFANHSGCIAKTYRRCKIYGGGVAAACYSNFSMSFSIDSGLSFGA